MLRTGVAGAASDAKGECLLCMLDGCDGSQVVGVGWAAEQNIEGELAVGLDALAVDGDGVFAAGQVAPQSAWGAAR